MTELEEAEEILYNLVMLREIYLEPEEIEEIFQRARKFLFKGGNESLFIKVKPMNL